MNKTKGIFTQFMISFFKFSGILDYPRDYPMNVLLSENKKITSGQ